MLRKLLKHEFRATAKTMLPLFLLLGVTALGARLSVYHLIESQNHWLEITAVVLLMLYVCCGFAVCVMSVVVMVQRFYKNLLQDEGYVMMTLPVSVHQQVWSKLIVSAVWFAVAAVVAGLSLLVMAADREILGGIGSFLDLIRSQITAKELVQCGIFFAEGLVVCFLGCCMFCLELYASMAVGYSRPGHKSAWSVAAFVVLSIVTNLLTTALGRMFQAAGIWRAFSEWAGSPAHGNQLFAAHLSLWLAALYLILFSAIYYCITTWFLKNRLNLE